MNFEMERLQEKHTSAHTLILAQWDPYQTFNFQK